MEQNENTLSVLKIAPGQHPQQVEIDNDLKALQQAVGGSIGAGMDNSMAKVKSLMFNANYTKLIFDMSRCRPTEL